MSTTILSGKKILLISVKFFNYENLIKRQLEEMGALVYLFDERPSNSFFSKAIIRIKKEIYATKINKYFESIIHQIQDLQLDYFLLIKGEATPQFFLDFLRDNNPTIKLIYYTFDSFKNNSNGLKILRNFDRKFTFDSEDANKHKLEFRPLFYADDYGNLYSSINYFDFALAFIGTAHSDRYYISEMAKNWCKNNGLNMFTFYYSPSKVLFKYKKLTDKGFKDFDFNKISFKSLTHSEIVDIYKSSKAILDINHPGQNGLTMRTFETLGAGRKLITTNPNIKKYPFYDAYNICVIDRKDFKIDYDFFNTEFKDISTNLLKSMSLEGWIEEIFGIVDVDYWKKVIE